MVVWHNVRMHLLGDRLDLVAEIGKALAVVGSEAAWAVPVLRDGNRDTIMVVHADLESPEVIDKVVAIDVVLLKVSIALFVRSR